MSAGQSGIIAGVCAILTILLVFTVVIVILMCYKKDNMENYTSKRFVHNHTEPRSYCLRSELNKVCVHRKVHSTPDKLNPVFQHTSSKDRPQISEPVFMESTATQACAPLIVTTSKPPQVHSESQSNSNFYHSAFWSQSPNKLPPKSQTDNKLISQFKHHIDNLHLHSHVTYHTLKRSKLVIICQQKQASIPQSQAHLYLLYSNMCFSCLHQLKDNKPGYNCKIGRAHV